MSGTENEKKIYFASDVHLGAAGIKDPKMHERIFVSWLDSIKESASEIYLLGDIFDFWWEYKTVIPRGFARFIGKLCELTDRGITIHYFTGNHDMWIFDYLPSETGVKLYREAVSITLNGKRFFLAHGDGLGSYDKKYNMLKSLFINKLAQKLFAMVHPRWGIEIAQRWSGNSRKINNKKYGHDYFGDDKEWLVLYSREVLKREHFDFFIYGHRHYAKVIELGEQSKMFYLGDWVNLFTYAEWNGEELLLKQYKFE
ncbi:MAG: UDP-2,3-diacylglucosamine diphosphatase [Breznakibacter sp.]|nr:UDP-2,3-diacylglucosamine diphosphatase [Breznakibacter sp.]